MRIRLQTKCVKDMSTLGILEDEDGDKSKSEGSDH